MIHTVEKKTAVWIFLPIFRSSIEKSTNMWIFESWIPICRGGGSLLILLSYSQFKGQAHRAKTKVPVGSTSDKLKKYRSPILEQAKDTISDLTAQQRYLLELED